MPQLRFRRVVAAASAALLVGGCGGEDFADRTAQVAVDGTTETYEVASCGLDDRTVFVVARAPSGAVLQLVMGMSEDLDEALPESTGVTVDVSDAPDALRLAAFGAESWQRRASVGSPPGTIDDARLRGSRIQVSGSALPVTGEDVPLPDGEPQPFSVDARCDRTES